MSEFRDTQSHFESNDAQVGGFNFDLCKRNEMILNSDSGNAKSQQKIKKTGTTIVGMIYKDGVVLGADTRATGGSTVMEKNCEKIHYMAPNIYCCGAGTAADTENTTGCDSRVVTAMTLLKRKLFAYQGHISAALVLGGVDSTGPHLYSVYPHGSTDKLPYVTMGSGSLAAMSVFETGYRDNMSEEEAKNLVADAVLAGVFNDLGSGSNVDLMTISKKDGKVSVHSQRNFLTPNNVEDLRSQVPIRNSLFKIPRGVTEVVSSKFEPFPSTLVVEGGASPMEL